MLLIPTSIGERHDAQFQILIDSDSLFASVHVVLVNGRTIEYFKLLVVDELVNVLVAEGCPPPVHENYPHLVQKGLQSLLPPQLESVASVIRQLSLQPKGKEGKGSEYQLGECPFRIGLGHLQLLVDELLQYGCNVDNVEVQVMGLHLAFQKLQQFEGYGIAHQVVEMVLVLGYYLRRRWLPEY